MNSLRLCFISLISILHMVFVFVEADDFNSHYMVTLQNRATKKYYGYDLTDAGVLVTQSRNTPFFFKALVWTQLRMAMDENWRMVSWTETQAQFYPFFSIFGNVLYQDTTKKITMKRSVIDYAFAYKSNLEASGDQFQETWVRTETADGYWQFESSKYPGICLAGNSIGSDNSDAGPKPGIPCLVFDSPLPETSWKIKVIAYGANNYNPITGDFSHCTFMGHKIVTIQNDVSKLYIGYGKAYKIKETKWPMFWTTLKDDYGNNFGFEPFFQTVSDGVLEDGDGGKRYLGWSHYGSYTISVFISSSHLDINFERTCVSGNPAVSKLQSHNFLNSEAKRCMAGQNGATPFSSISHPLCSAANDANQKWRITVIPLSASSVVTGDSIINGNGVDWPTKLSKKPHPVVLFSLWQLFAIIVLALFSVKLLGYLFTKTYGWLLSKSKTMFAGIRNNHTKKNKAVGDYLYEMANTTTTTEESNADETDDALRP